MAIKEAPIGVPVGELFQLVGKTMTQDLGENETILPNMVDNMEEGQVLIVI